MTQKMDKRRPHKHDNESSESTNSAEYFDQLSEYKLKKKRLCLSKQQARKSSVNPLNAELNPIYHFLALLGAHPILHVSGVRVKLQ
jgi:hypothetical protein